VARRIYQIHADVLTKDSGEAVLIDDPLGVFNVSVLGPPAHEILIGGPLRHEAIDYAVRWAKQRGYTLPVIKTNKVELH
jgi:hypothetical protein